VSKEYIIRQATESDVPFIAEGIIAAEKSGTERLGYSTIYEIPEKEFVPLLEEMLYEDIEGQELSISGFLILEAEGLRASCCTAWIEGSCGLSSSMLKSSLLLSYIPKQNLEKAATKSKFLNEIALNRTGGAIQIESVYTKKHFRGRGYSSILIHEQVKRMSDINKGVSKVELIVTGKNIAAINSYKKAGFETIYSVTGNCKELETLLPSTTMMLMQSDTRNFIK